MQSNTKVPPERKSAKIKSVKEKGFGFLETEEGDVFFHVSDISDGSTPIKNAVYYFDVSTDSAGKKVAKKMSLSPAAPVTDLYDWSFIPFGKALPDLADLALDEDWSYRDKETEPFDKYGVLRSYIRFTFTRLSYEKKILEKEDYAIFNTGLVDRFYEPIFALFEPNELG